MLSVILYISMLVVGSITLNSLEFSSMDAETAVTILFYVIYVVWGIGVVCCISNCVRTQIENLNKIEERKEEKESYMVEMNRYKDEMKNYLTKEFPAFEERIIKNISDSKALATIIEKEGFQKILKLYNDRIIRYLSDIEGKDRLIASLVSNLKTSQQDKLGYGIFIPKKYQF